MTLIRILWMLGGTLFLVIGLLGVILPLIPGTIFLMAAAACFLRASDRLHRWMHDHHLIGPHLRAISEGRGMPVPARIITLVMMWAALAVSIVKMDVLILEIFLVLFALVGSAVIAYPRLLRIAIRRD